LGRGAWRGAAQNPSRNGRKIEMYVVGEYTKQQLRTIGRTALQQMSL
jgi:hypothetical protein